MKKALIIANMLFASATVFGMNSKSIQTKEAISQSANMSQMSSVKNESPDFFKILQSWIKDADWLSEDAKFMFNELDFKDVRIAIKQVSKPDFLNKSNTKDFFDRIWSNVRSGKEYVDIVEKVRDNAKKFYKQVLGDSEQGKVLYEKAVETIDTGKYIQCSNLMQIRNSFFKPGEKITVRYYNADDFLLTLIHETGHALDSFYRSNKGLPESIPQQREYVSTFFETLLASPNFRGNLYFSDSSLYGLRIGEIYLDLLKKNLINELMLLYDKDTLFKFYQVFGNFSFTEISEGEKNIELNKVLDDLEHNPKTKLFMDVIYDLNKRGIIFNPNYNNENDQEKEIKWRECLQRLGTIQGYDDLKQFLHDADIGKGIWFNKTSPDKDGHYSLFSYDSEIKRFELPNELKGIDWNEIFGFARNKAQKFADNFEKMIMTAGCMSVYQENLNSWRLWNFIGSSTKLKFIGVFQKVIPYLGKLNGFFNRKIDLEFWTYIVRMSADCLLPLLNISNLDNHTEGAYNAFRLIKEKGYFGMLENGQSLSIEEAMEELTKPAEPLNLKEEPVKEFLEFSRTGKLKSTDPKIVLNQ